jgi:ribonuclease R
MKRGALDFDLPEAVVKLDAEGKPTSVSRRSSDPGMKKAYQLIEELMVFANEVVARWLLEHELPDVCRVHLPPDPKKLDKRRIEPRALRARLGGGDRSPR